MSITVTTIIKVPPEQLVSLRERKKRLVLLKLTRDKKDQLDERSEELLKEVQRLLRTLVSLRIEHPDSAKLIVGLENDLLDAFPEGNLDNE